VPELLTQDTHAEEKETGRHLSEYIAMFRRHTLQILAVTAVLGAAFAAVAIGWPPLYRSSATIIVQEQEIPRDLVRSTVTSFADERIEVISQQVMTSAVLLPLIEKYNLYDKYRKKETDHQIVKRMLDDIRVTPIDARISDRGSGSRVNTTIAFEISYDSPQPERAQMVVNELVELYLHENVKARRQSVAETTAFLAEEAERVAEHIREIETNLADFKRRYAGIEPDSSAANMQLAERTQADILRNDREINILQDRILSLEAQLHFVKPNLPFAADSNGKTALTPEARLQALMAEYISASAVYRAEHPKMRDLMREIDLLKSVTGALGTQVDASGKLEELEAELAALRERYADDHPDIRRLERSIEALKASAGSQATAPRAVDKAPDNPAYLALTTQLESAKRELAYLSGLRDDLREKQRTYDERLQKIPEIEREYRELTRDYDSAQANYREVKAKQMEAQIAQELEKDRKAERFALLEPPNLPVKPISPNRKRIALIGLVASLGSGFSLAWLRDLMNPSVKGPLELTRIVRTPILNPIPYIETRRERLGRRLRTLMVVCLIPVLAAASFAGVLSFLSFLNQVWI
jgi:uncharacterized protein involved in exopolysaccharide biosynthesis